jgi:hypothetical protein
MSGSVPPVSTDFLLLIGRIVIAWSKLERALDLTVLSGRPLIPSHFEKGPPRTLSPKLKALRSLCKKLAVFSERHPWVEQCIGEVKAMAEDRHTIIHGFFHGISGEQEPQIYFRRAPPMSGEAGKRLLATRLELGNFVQRLEKSESDFRVMRLMVVQEMGHRRARDGGQATN